MQFVTIMGLGPRAQSRAPKLYFTIPPNRNILCSFIYLFCVSKKQFIPGRKSQPRHCLDFSINLMGWTLSVFSSKNYGAVQTWANLMLSFFKPKFCNLNWLITISNNSPLILLLLVLIQLKKTYTALRVQAPELRISKTHLKYSWIVGT